MLNFEPGTVIWTLISFGLAYAVVAWKVYPRLKGFLEQRRELIETSLAEAEKSRLEAERLQAGIDERQRAVSVEELRILSEAREKSRALQSEFERRAQEEMRVTKSKQKEDLERMEQDFIRGAHERIARLVIDSCERILRLELSAEQHHRIIEERIREFERMKI
jgi:F-type H+-transporting ATPase subunit b